MIENIRYSDLSESDKRELDWFDNLSNKTKNIILYEKGYSIFKYETIKNKIREITKLVQ